MGREIAVTQRGPLQEEPDSLNRVIATWACMLLQSIQRRDTSTGTRYEYRGRTDQGN